MTLFGTVARAKRAACPREARPRRLSVYNPQMSRKRYQFKLIEAADAAELETKLRDAGTKLWSAVGYGVLPDGHRSVLMERKIKVRHHGHHHRHDDDRRAVANDR